MNIAGLLFVILLALVILWVANLLFGWIGVLVVILILAVCLLPSLR